MKTGLAALIGAGALWWYPWCAVAFSAAVPLSGAALVRSACLSVAGLLLAAYGAALVRRAGGRNRATTKLAFGMIPLGMILAHAGAMLSLDLRTKFDPFAGRPSAHASCAPDVAKSVTVLSTRESHSARSPYIDVALDVEADRDVSVEPAGDARDENSGARLPILVEPKSLAKGRGTLTLRLMDADDLRLKGRPLVFRNLQVYVRSAACDAQPRATLVPRLKVLR